MSIERPVTCECLFWVKGPDESVKTYLEARFRIPYVPRGKKQRTALAQALMQNKFVQSIADGETAGIEGEIQTITEKDYDETLSDEEVRKFFYNFLEIEHVNLVTL